LQLLNYRQNDGKFTEKDDNNYGNFWLGFMNIRLRFGFRSFSTLRSITSRLPPAVCFGRSESFLYSLGEIIDVKTFLRFLRHVFNVFYF